MGRESRKREREREHKKPTGTLGFLQLGPEGASYTAERFPGSKAAIERYILDKALSIAREKGQELYELTGDPVQNNENDIDFTLTTRSGTEYLDLMEIALGPYSTAPHSYVVGERAERIWAKIACKVYDPSITVHLILYPTHAAFDIEDKVAKLLGLRCRSRARFKSIVYVDVVTSFLIPVHPRPPEDFAGFNAAAARGTRIVLADLTSVQVAPGAPSCRSVP